jgi:hypothetical protein
MLVWVLHHGYRRAAFPLVCQRQNYYHKNEKCLHYLIQNHKDERQIPTQYFRSHFIVQYLEVHWGANP